MVSVLIVATGFGLVAASVYAERYHSRRMKENIDAMRDAYLHRGEEAAAREYRKLDDDWRVMAAIYVMQYGAIIGIALICYGLFVGVVR